jgi:hypothetical protein
VSSDATGNSTVKLALPRTVAAAIPRKRKLIMNETLAKKGFLDDLINGFSTLLTWILEQAFGPEWSVRRSAP